MEFVGFSFHFTDEADSSIALAAVASMERGRAGKGIDPSSLQRLADGFYIGWVSAVSCAGA